MNARVVLFCLAGWVGEGAGENLRPSISLSLESFERVSPFVLQVEAVCDHEGISEGGERDAAWDLVSGEGGGVRIERVSALEGRFEFRRPGRYVLRCLVTDGELEGGRDFLVEVGEEGIASYRRIEGLELSLEAYEARAIMENARGARCWELLFSGAKQADGRLLAIEFGESLPTSGTGALSLNREWEAGKRESFFIEQQRYGADVIETGVILGDEDLVAEGIRMIDWGFERQGGDGSFPGTGDEVHSSSLFIEAAARAGLALERYKPRAYRETILEWRRRVNLAAHWFVEADEAGRDVNLEPFGHRYFLRAAALELAARFTRDGELSAYADEYIEEVLPKQRGDGSFLERGGFDASYQMVGMTFASRYFAVGRNRELRQEVSLAIWNGVGRFLEEVLPTGEVVIGDKSRTASEKSRTGSAKRFDYKHAMKALVFAEEGLFMTGAGDVAESILEYWEGLE